MKNIIKAIFSSLLFLILNFSYGQSLCNLQLALETDLYKSDELLETLSTKPKLLNSWENLHLAGSKFVKTNPTYLQTFNKLSPENQKLIAQFTDVDANSTLAKFLDDIKADNDFLNLINDAENNIYAKGLVLHKPSVADNLTADELRQLNDFVEDLDEIPNLNFKKWLNRSENLSNLQKYASQGTAFGKEMITQLKNIDSDAYKTLKTTLSEKSIDIVEYNGKKYLVVDVNRVGNVALDVATATEKQLDDIFEGIQNSPPFKYAPNTLEHKAERWAQYKVKLGSDAKDYSNWSNIYNSNMTKATKAHQAADEVMASIGWGQREVTVRAGTYTRRMDIADKVAKKGVEVKSYETGKVYATEAIKGELNADKYLIDNDFWQIEWVFKGCEPSQPLRTLLEQGGITIKLVP